VLTPPVMPWTEKVRLAGFFGRLAVKERLVPGLSVRPLVAELFLTDNCNLRCISCACWRSVTRNELDGEEWRDVLDQLVAMRILKVNFTGGEPLLRQDAPELMAYARAGGIRHVHLNTNAILLDEARRTAVLDAGVRSFNVSVDGPDAQLHDAVRGRSGAFETTVAHLEELVSRRSQLRLRLRMNYTVMRSNIDALPEMMRLAQRLGIQLYLNLATDHTFLFRDGQVTLESRVSAERVDAALVEVESILRADRSYLPRYAELSYLRAHFREVLQPGLPCAESQLKLMIRSTGEVGGCWGHDPHRNVRTAPLSEIVAGTDYRDEHDRLFRKECVGCGSNYALNLAWRPRSYVQDGLWRVGRRSLAVPAPAAS
jgi:MoaA/NifB/PqqE/SkfB family radical SAM enzyme